MVILGSLVLGCVKRVTFQTANTLVHWKCEGILHFLFVNLLLRAYGLFTVTLLEVTSGVSQVASKEEHEDVLEII